MKLLFTITLIFGFFTAIFSQYIRSEEIDNSKVKNWNTKQMSDYQGIFKFGYSESESELKIIFNEGKFYAQIKEGYWNETGDKWRTKYTNLKDLKTKDHKFYSSLSNGEFIIYELDGLKQFGLKIYKPWSGQIEKNKYEIGLKLGDIESMYSGKYSKASASLLKESDLKNLSKQELKIMRNEIFARYGYIFESGGEMNQYFKKQDWYNGEHTDVKVFLTDLEKKNIEIISSLEKK